MGKGSAICRLGSGGPGRSWLPPPQAIDTPGELRRELMVYPQQRPTMRFYSFVLKNVVRRRVRSTSDRDQHGRGRRGGGRPGGHFQRLRAVVHGTSTSNRKWTSSSSSGASSSGSPACCRAKLADQIAKIPGVKQVNSGLVDFTSMDELGPVGVLVQGWEPDSPLMKALDILPGGHLLTYADKKGVLLGEQLAISLDKHVGRQDDPLRQRDLHRDGHLQERHGLRERQHGRVASGIAAVHGPPGPGERLRHRRRASRGPGGNQANRPRH